MDTTLIVALVAGASVIAGALVTAVVGPVIYPWYGERMSKAQLRVQRRMQVRQMIENELSKGFYDLATVGAYLMTLLIESQVTAQAKFTQMIIDNEVKFGPWLGYNVQDSDLKSLCQRYRDLIRDARMIAASPPPVAKNAEALLTKAKKDSEEEAAKIVARMDQLGW